MKQFITIALMGLTLTSFGQWSGSTEVSRIDGTKRSMTNGTVIIKYFPNSTPEGYIAFGIRDTYVCSNAKVELSVKVKGEWRYHSVKLNFTGGGNSWAYSDLRVDDPVIQDILDGSYFEYKYTDSCDSKRGTSSLSGSTAAMHKAGLKLGNRYTCNDETACNYSERGASAEACKYPLENKDCKGNLLLTVDLKIKERNASEKTCECNKLSFRVLNLEESRDGFNRHPYYAKFEPFQAMTSSTDSVISIAIPVPTYLDSTHDYGIAIHETVFGSTSEGYCAYTITSATHNGVDLFNHTRQWEGRGSYSTKAFFTIPHLSTKD